MTKTNYRLHWDTDLGWLLDVDVTLTRQQLARVCNWAIKHQIQRWNSLPLGPKKDELALAIQQLKQYKIQQIIIETKGGENLLFKSTQGTGKIFSVGGI